MPKMTMSPVAIAVICVLGAVVITFAFLPLMTKASTYVPPPKRGSWAPPFDPGNVPNIKPSNPNVCLPGTLGYNGLVTCTRQADCHSCTDDSTLQCITVNNTSNQLVDPGSKELSPPVPIHLYRKANGMCSGRGEQKSCDDPNAPPNCTDYWCDCSPGYTSANNDPTNCDVQVLNVTQPGAYCLPSYVNACNPYSSDTVLSNQGSGPEWTCECKYTDPQIFQQNAEGNDCSIPIVCGSQEPQMVRDQVAKVLKYTSTRTTVPGVNCIDVPGLSGTPNDVNWKLCDSYPNQLVTSNALNTTPCVVPTVTNTVKIDNKLAKATQYSYVEYQASPLADPTCITNPFVNTCTVQTAVDSDGGVIATQVLRGSGTPGDPQLSRLWPPFPTILPFDMQACPDGWTGNGTPASPCSDGKGFTFSYLDQYGQWNGQYLSLQELRNVGYTGPDATVCSPESPCSAGQVCSSANVCATSCAQGSPCPAGTGCYNGICTAVNDQSCSPFGTVAVGLPGTLGGIPWQTVNSGCPPTPSCLETPVTMQQVTRSWTTPANLFPVTSSNIAQSTCSSSAQGPMCSCPIGDSITPCKQDSDCNPSGKTGGVCNFTPVFPKACSGTSDCGKKSCNQGRCDVSCKIDSDCNEGEFCNAQNVCTVGLCTCGVDGLAYSCSNPEATELCSAVTGAQLKAYNGAQDGPVIDENGLAKGGTCACNGFVLNDNGQKVPLVPGALLDESLAWTCVPDPCFVPGSKNSYYSSVLNQCVCGADGQGATYYSWNTNNGVPTCQRDPCNPSGTTSNIQVTCKTDGQCSSESVACNNSKCYVWTTKSCSPTSGSKDCVEGIGGGQSVECLQHPSDKSYYCAVEDTTRSGSGCSQASDCALGICNKLTGLCTGGCICSAGTEPYFTDANPLHSACTNPCVFNPCGANGTCESDGSSFKCNCLPGFSGESCENRSCLPPDTPCSSDAQCCNSDRSAGGGCTYGFLVGHTCN